MSTKHVAFPFNTLDDTVVGFTGWLIGDPGQPGQPAPEVLDWWDYNRDLEVAVELRMDIDKVARALDLQPQNARFAVTLKAGTGTGILPRRVDCLRVGRLSREEPEVNLVARIPSSHLSGRLRLEVGVLLDCCPVTAGDLSPVAQGSRLWCASKNILLEDGGASRFPIEMVSFSKAFESWGLESAPWYLHWKDKHLDADFSGSVRIYVNSDVQDIADRFVHGDPPTLQAILADVMSQMVSSLILIDDCDDRLADCETGSIGHQILQWMDMAFPGRTATAIRDSFESTPGRFRAALLAAARVGESE